MMGREQEITAHPWPSYDEEIAKEEEIELVVQVNGKVRARIAVGIDEEEESLKEIVLSHQKIKEWIQEKPVRKFVVIPNKLVNVVI